MVAVILSTLVVTSSLGLFIVSCIYLLFVIMKVLGYMLFPKFSQVGFLQRIAQSKLTLMQRYKKIITENIYDKSDRSIQMLFFLAGLFFFIVMAFSFLGVVIYRIFVKG